MAERFKEPFQTDGSLCIYVTKAAQFFGTQAWHNGHTCAF